MGEVLCDGFSLAMIYTPVIEGDKTHICIVAIKGKTTGFIHIGLFTLSTSCHRSYCITPFFHELNTLDACWIAVDVWSNSSRCRQELVY